MGRKWKWERGRIGSTSSLLDAVGGLPNLDTSHPLAGRRSCTNPGMFKHIRWCRCAFASCQSHRAFTAYRAAAAYDERKTGLFSSGGCRIPVELDELSHLDELITAKVKEDMEIKQRLKCVLGSSAPTEAGKPSLALRYRSAPHA